jgi:hypothetical protein
MSWLPTDVTNVELVPDTSEGDIITIRVDTPAGQVRVMGDIDIVGRVLIVRRAHIHSEQGANAVGVANLRVIAEVVLERMDCDEARIEGATRTTGASPGHRPREIRFTRRSGAKAR